MRQCLMVVRCLFPLWGIVVHPQSLPDLHPPAQPYVYDFNGSAGVAPVAPALDLGASFSIEFWMMFDRNAVDSQYMKVLQKGIPNTGDPFTGYEMDIEPGTHQLSYAQSTGVSGSYRSAKIGVALQAGQWYHLAIVNDNLQVTLYLNGQRQAGFTAAGPPPINSFPLTLAAQAYGDGTAYCCGFPGSLRQFRIWGRALQPAEIAVVATELLSGTEAGLIADWALNDGQGTAPRDIGPNHLTLTLRVNGNSLAFPNWKRTAILDQAPVFQVQKLSMPAQSIPFPKTIPIDFDSDGNMDLLVCQSAVTTNPSPCAAFRNDGKGNFSDATKQVLGPNPPGFETPRDFCIADFDGDGRADVFIANTGECPGCTNKGGQSTLLLQTADGRLQDATAAAGLPQERMFTHNVACGDVDGDGNVDLYYQNFFYQPPALFLNDGHGHFTPGDPARLPPILRSTQFAAITAKFIDVNHDGRLDLYVGLNHGDNQPHDLLLLNDGHGFFTLSADNALPNRYGGRNWGTVCISVADFDGDGWPDLINAVYGGPFYNEGAVQILLNNHNGTFRDATDLFVQPAWARHGSDVLYLDPVFPADFNGDGSIDLLVHGSGQRSRLFLNTGPGGGNHLVDVSELLPDTADRFAVADFNGDRVPDIVGWSIDCCNPMFLETWLTTRQFTLTPDLIPPVPTGPFFLRGSVLNSATLSGDALAPGQIMTVFGRDFGPSFLAVAAPLSGEYPTELAGTRVLVNGVAAPILYAAAGQVSAAVPYGVVPDSRADVVLEYQGERSPPVSIYVAASAPGLFTLDGTGAGPAVVLNTDPMTGAVSVNSSDNPAPRGGYVVAYITGAGQTTPPSADGVVANSTGGLALPIEAGLDYFGFGQACKSNPNCQPVEVLYAGPAPGVLAGVTQVKMRVPDTPAASGVHPLGISVGGIWSQNYATVSIR